MTKPFEQFVAATTGRNLTKAAYVAISTGVAMMILLTVNPAYEAAHHWVDAVLWACWPSLCSNGWSGSGHAFQAQRGWTYATSGRGLIDAAAAIAVPLAMIFGVDPKTAWLLSIAWMLR